MSNDRDQTAAGGLPQTNPSPRQNVDRLLAELKAALISCDVGPLRAMVDSDGSACIQPLSGRPVVNGGRLVGVPVIMGRVAEDKPRWPHPLDLQNENEAATVSHSGSFDGAGFYTFGGLTFEHRPLWAEADNRVDHPGWIAICDHSMGRLICQMSPSFFDEACTGIWRQLPQTWEGAR